MGTDLVHAAADHKVTVIAPGGRAPGIISKMVPITLADKTIAEEAARYASLTDLRGKARGTKEAYEALVDGRVMVNLYETLNRSIVTVDSIHYALPQVAAARPTDRVLYSRSYAGGLVDFYAQSWTGKRSRTPFFTVGSGSRTKNSYTTRQAVVPTLPPEVRQQFPGALKDGSGKFMILFEPSWSVISHREPRPPARWDPALLEQVEGSIYLVRAVWDLSPVEIAALLPGPRF